MSSNWNTNPYNPYRKWKTELVESSYSKFPKEKWVITFHEEGKGPYDGYIEYELPRTRMSWDMRVTGEAWKCADVYERKNMQV